MARDGRDDVRSGPEQTAERTGSSSRDGRSVGVPMERLRLPTGADRQPVRVREHVYRLRESEAKALATVGVFRVVRADDLQAAPSSRDAWRGDLRALAEQGLVQMRTVEVNREATAVVVLTPSGKQLLEANRIASDRLEQTFHAGLVKPREIAHDSQLYRLYQAEAARIQDEGGRVERIVLDYELKRDYQTFLNRSDRPDGSSLQDEMRAFAEAGGLPVVDDHLELPDLRIEYETSDGRLEYRDVELVTEHYSRGQLAGKTAAGFALYRAAGAGRARGQGGRRGGTPFDPHNLERL